MQLTGLSRNASGLLLWALYLCATSLATAAIGQDAIATEAPAAGQKRVGSGELTLSELFDIPVITASRKPTSYMTTPSAVYVLTGEDIRRSGATTIPDVLRLVPGVQVAQVNTGGVGVSVRGFNQEYSNRLLVMVDGRTIYTPVFSGVVWMELGLMLENIERIEVIRGPGSAVWGANAVNGVINIITKAAEKTQAGLISLGGGDVQNAFGSVRYGDLLGKNGSYRIWAGAYDRAGLHSSNPSGPLLPSRNWRAAYGGARIDTRINECDAFMISAAFFDQQLIRDIPEFSPAPPYRKSLADRWVNTGADIMGRWTRQLGNSTKLALQTYYDHADRDNEYLGHDQDMVDADATLHTAWGQRHDLIVGVGYRYFSGHMDSDFTVTSSAQFYDENLYSAFAQYDLALIVDRLHAIAGVKTEHFNSVGWEVQPTLRFSFTPDVDHTLWAAVTRAVRTPALVDRDVQRTRKVSPPGTADPIYPTVSVQSVSLNPSVDETVAYEAGYRLRPRQNVWLDLSLFYNDYENIQAFGPTSTEFKDGPQPYIEARSETEDAAIEGNTYGVEIASSWQVTASWRLQGTYSYLKMDMKATSPSVSDGYPDFFNNGAPAHQATLRSLWNVTPTVDLDADLRFVDKLEAGIDEYLVSDLRAAWRPRPDFELSLVARDLYDPHREWISLQSTEVAPSVYAKVEWLF